MYLHLGNDIVIKKKDILGIYDIDNTTISKRTREFLESYEKTGRLTYTTNELPKSFIVSPPLSTVAFITVASS